MRFCYLKLGIVTLFLSTLRLTFFQSLNTLAPRIQLSAGADCSKPALRIRSNDFCASQVLQNHAHYKIKNIVFISNSLLVKIGVRLLPWVRNGDLEEDRRSNAETDRDDQILLHGSVMESLEESWTRDGSTRRGNGSSFSGHLKHTSIHARTHTLVHMSRRRQAKHRFSYVTTKPTSSLPPNSLQ